VFSNFLDDLLIGVALIQQLIDQGTEFGRELGDFADRPGTALL